MQNYKILLQGGEDEVTEKKSRFIATVRPVKNEEEATAFINEMKKKYWDAKHNCSGFVIGSNNEIMRSSDDGEPSGTAGRPILEVLLKSQIHDAAIVVTRYFGGILLGTGGLIRAYTEAAKAGLAACETGILTEGRKVMLSFGYNEVGKVQNYLREKNVQQEQAIYEEKVSIRLLVANGSVECLGKELTELCNGRIQIEDQGACTFLTGSA